MLEGTKKQAQSQIFMSLGPQMAKIKMDNWKGVNFYTGPYGDPSHKNINV